jgi:preprotein translocase subunit SecE
MQRQRDVEDNGAPAVEERPQLQPRPRPQAPQMSAPARVVEFGREIRSEMKQVAWPTRPEVVNSATVVLITLVFLIGLIFALNYAFSHLVISILSHPSH